MTKEQARHLPIGQRLEYHTDNFGGRIFHGIVVGICWRDLLVLEDSGNVRWWAWWNERVKKEFLE